MFGKFPLLNRIQLQRGWLSLFSLIHSQKNSMKASHFLHFLPFSETYLTSLKYVIAFPYVEQLGSSPQVGVEISTCLKPPPRKPCTTKHTLIPSHYTGCVFKELPWALFKNWHTKGSVKPPIRPKHSFVQLFSCALKRFLCVLNSWNETSHCKLFLPHAYSSIKMLKRNKRHPKNKSKLVVLW